MYVLKVQWIDDCMRCGSCVVYVWPVTLFAREAKDDDILTPKEEDNLIMSHRRVGHMAYCFNRFM